MPRNLIIVLFFVYGLLIVWLTFFYAGEQESRSSMVVASAHNFIPFKNIHHYYSQYDIHGWPVRRAFLINVFGNLLLLIPFGFFIYLFLPRRSLLLYLLIALGVPLSIECGQALTQRGIFDIDDIILNSIGYLMGTYAAFLNSKPNTSRF